MSTCSNHQPIWDRSIYACGHQHAYCRWCGETTNPCNEGATMNPLTDVLPARVRQIAYAVLFVAALVFATYQAADGDWLVFAGSLITSLLGALAASNTSVD